MTNLNIFDSVRFKMLKKAVKITAPIICVTAVIIIIIVVIVVTTTGDNEIEEIGRYMFVVSKWSMVV